MRFFDTLDDLKPFVFRILDNGGATADRWTVATCDGEWTSMSSDPFSPQGVCGRGEGFDPAALSEGVESGDDVDVTWEALPPACRRCVADALDADMAALADSVVPAPDRDAATDFEGWRAGGGPDCVSSIHLDRNGALRIRDDGRREADGEDPGPFATVREAVLRLLPEAYDLSGPEHHPEIDMWAKAA